MKEHMRKDKMNNMKMNKKQNMMNTITKQNTWMTRRK